MVNNIELKWNVIIGECEWEIIVSHWPLSERFNDKKIDVYEQVMLNWEVFITYLWNYYYLRSTKKEKYR